MPFQTLCIWVSCLLTLFFLVVCVFSYVGTRLILIVSTGLTKTLGNPDANLHDPVGVDLARIGLGGPLRPPLVGVTPRPSTPGLDDGEGWFCLFSIFALSPFYLSFVDAYLLFQVPPIAQ